MTKADLAMHMATVAPAMLPHLRDRPLTLVRAPDGINADRFFQKDAHHLAKHFQVCSFDGVDYVLVRTAEDLVRLADQATVEVHGWTSRCDRPEVPDRIVFDLDPPGQEDFDTVREVAKDLCLLLRERGGTPFPLLTGSKGVHVVVPLERGAALDEVRAFTDAVARVMVRHDERLTTEVRKAKRNGRVFFDTLRNRPRQTAVMPWSPRARDGAPFALPIHVADLDDPDLDPRRGRIGEAKASVKQDPWAGFFDKAVPLSRLA